MLFRPLLLCFHMVKGSCSSVRFSFLIIIINIIMVIFIIIITAPDQELCVLIMSLQLQDQVVLDFARRADLALGKSKEVDKLRCM